MPWSRELERELGFGQAALISVSCLPLSGCLWNIRPCHALAHLADHPPSCPTFMASWSPQRAAKMPLTPALHIELLTAACLAREARGNEPPLLAEPPICFLTITLVLTVSGGWGQACQAAPVDD